MFHIKALQAYICGHEVSCLQYLQDLGLFRDFEARAWSFWQTFYLEHIEKENSRIFIPAFRSKLENLREATYPSEKEDARTIWQVPLTISLVGAVHPFQTPCFSLFSYPIAWLEGLGVWFFPQPLGTHPS